MSYKRLISILDQPLELYKSKVYTIGPMGTLELTQYITLEIASHQNPHRGWELMQKAIRIFEKLCTPINAMPDHPIMFSTEQLQDINGVWAYIRSAELEAERGGQYDHNYVDATVGALKASVLILKTQPPDDPNVLQFVEMLGITPQEFDLRFLQS